MRWRKINGGITKMLKQKLSGRAKVQQAIAEAQKRLKKKPAKKRSKPAKKKEPKKNLPEEGTGPDPD